MGGKSVVTCTRRLEFDAAHRVVNHESKCATLHGHRYAVEVEAQANELDAIGRVIDFSVIKEKLGTWLDLHWDHNSILFIDDGATIEALESIPRKKDPYILLVNPTAENMAEFLLNIVCPDLFSTTGIVVIKVTVWETPNCFAVAKLVCKPAVAE